MFPVTTIRGTMGDAVPYRWFVMLIILGTGLVFSQPPPQPALVSWESLLRDMADLRPLANWPAPAYQTQLFSSYHRLRDRASLAPGQRAGVDRGHALYEAELLRDAPFFTASAQIGQQPAGQLTRGMKVGLCRDLPTVRDHVWVYAWTAEPSQAEPSQQGYVARSALSMLPEGAVLAEMDGPGCLVRFWSANPSAAGKVRIYLDHAAAPVIEASLLDLLSGAWPSLGGAAAENRLPASLAGERGRSFQLTLPISFAKHCRVMVDQIADLSYQIHLRRYEPDTVVEGFTLAHLSRYRELIETLHRQHALPLQPASWDQRASSKLVAPLTATIKPGGQAEGVIAAPGLGSGAIVQMDGRVEAAALDQALRCTLLRITFDDAAQPQVEAPLGDFFGTAPGLKPYASLPMEVSAEGWLRCRWFMPWQKHARWQLLNHGAQTVIVQPRFVVADYPWTPTSMHLHARWQTASGNPSGAQTPGPTLEVRGQGVFVGAQLAVLNPDTEWWGGEGETVRVDGQVQRGTGLDAYFGFAWGDTTWLQHPFHHHARHDGPGHWGFSSCHRYHRLDAVPFRHDLRWQAPLPAQRTSGSLAWDMVFFWYARPGCTVVQPDRNAQPTPRLPSTPELYRIAGALEGEHLRVARQSSLFTVQEQAMPWPSRSWSGGAILAGRPRRRGDWATLSLPVARPGEYRLIVHLAKGPEHGILRFSLGDQPLGEPIDAFHADGVVPSGPIDLGPVTLKAGDVELRLAVVGHHPKATGIQWTWGLDAVVLQPVGR